VEQTVLEQEVKADGTAVVVVVGRVDTAYCRHSIVVVQHAEEQMGPREVEVVIVEQVVLGRTEGC
jgi:hypothetical protein